MSERRRGLGRGLAALIPTEAPPSSEAAAVGSSGASTPEGQERVDAGPAAPARAGGGHDSPALVPAHYLELPLDAVRPNPRQPRQVFDPEALAELVHSIREIGLLQPIVVRPLPADGEPAATERYELVAGERRLRASREAGLATIPAIVRDTPDDALLRDALLENLHRAQLNVLEEAAAYQQLLDDFGCTQEELATRIGRSRPQVSNTLRLLRLPPSVQRRVAAGVLSAGHARAVLSLDDADAMERLSGRIVAEGLSVRDVEELVLLGEADGRARESTRRPRAKAAASPELAAVAERLGERLETRVSIEPGKARGRLVIEYASAEDLHRIAALIEGRAP